jgi:hypothetical protein
MTRQTGYAAETTFRPVYRNCNTTGCLPAHVFVGGNTWIPAHPAGRALAATR